MRLQDAARVIRSKNAGPTPVTIDLMFDDEKLSARALKPRLIIAVHIVIAQLAGRRGGGGHALAGIALLAPEAVVGDRDRRFAEDDGRCPALRRDSQDIAPGVAAHRQHRVQRG